MFERLLIVLAASALPWLGVAAQSPPGSAPCDNLCHMRIYFYSFNRGECAKFSQAACTFCPGNSLSLCGASPTDPPNCVSVNPTEPITVTWHPPSACTLGCTAVATTQRVDASSFSEGAPVTATVNTYLSTCTNSNPGGGES